MRIDRFLRKRAATWPALALLVSPAVSAPNGYQTRVQSLNPLLWYRLNEVAGDALNQGSLGATHNASYFGSVTRGVATAGGDAGARFDGGDDFVQSFGSSPLAGNPEFSAEAIVRLDNPGAANLWGPFLHWGGGATGRAVYFSISNASNSVIYAGFYNAGLRTASAVPTNQWIHVVWTRTGGSGSNSGTTLFINGRVVPLQIDEALNPGVLTAAQIDVVSTQFQINRAADFFGSRFFTGALDEVVLYNRRLTATEARNNALASDVPGVPDCPGDANGDGVVNFTDLNIVLSEFGQSGVGLDGDLNESATVDFSDLNIVLSSFGITCANATAQAAPTD